MAQRTLTLVNNIIANVAVMGNHGDYLPVDFNTDGSLAIPDNLSPRIFLLTILVPAELNPILTQRNLSRLEGEYHSRFIKNLGNIMDFQVAVLPINVTRSGRNTWTSFTKESPNNMDCWLCGPRNAISMFKVGLITHDDGKTYRVIGETRWAGDLFIDNAQIVGKPSNSMWGSFGVRDTILNHPEFQDFIKKARLPMWQGKPEELEPPLPEVPEGDYGVVKFFHPMMGQKGQALVVIHGDEAWLFGNNLDRSPDADGVKRLQRGDVITYQAIKHPLERKNGKPLPTLLNATKV
jgi:hypothetical protein